MEKQLIYFDQQRYNSQIGSYQLFKTLIEQAIKIYNSFNIGSFVPGDLEALILAPEAYVTNKLMESKDLTPLTKMGLDRNKIIEMLSMPPGLPVLLEKINQLERLFQQYKEASYLSVRNLKDLINYYSFSSDTMLILKESFSDSYKKKSETWIETNEAKNLFSFASEIIKLYEKYGIKFTSRTENVRLLENLFSTNGDKLAININSILDVERRSK